MSKQTIPFIVQDTREQRPDSFQSKRTCEVVVISDVYVS